MTLTEIAKALAEAGIPEDAELELFSASPFYVEEGAVKLNTIKGLCSTSIFARVRPVPVNVSPFG